jgi:hypothetical protein
MGVHVEHNTREGQAGTTEFASDDEAGAHLRERLAAHRALGHRILSEESREFIVQDASGEWVANYRLIHADRRMPAAAPSPEVLLRPPD